MSDSVPTAEPFRPAFAAGLARAQKGLTGLLGTSAQLEGTVIRLLPVLSVPTLIDDPDQVVTALYLEFQGDLKGYCALCFDQRSARWLAARLLDLPPEGVPADLAGDPLACSALAELGNICVSNFLNGLADHCRLTIAPSPVLVTVDFLGAVVQTVLLPLSLTDANTLAIETYFTFPGTDQVRGFLLLLPDNHSLDVLRQALKGSAAG